MSDPPRFLPTVVELLGGSSPTAGWLSSEEARSLLLEPDRRARLYAAMHVAPSPMQAPLLRELLKHEVDYRISDEDGDAFEQLYWCALLLSGLGFVEDALPLWRAKQTNFDTGVGFDVQFIVGAGVEESLAHLESLDDPDAARASVDVKECEEAGDFRDLESWRARRRAYFMPED